MASLPGALSVTALRFALCALRSGVSGRALSRDGRRGKGVKRLPHRRLYVRHAWREYKPYPVPVSARVSVTTAGTGEEDAKAERW